MEPDKPPCLLLPTVCVNNGKMTLPTSSEEQPSTSGISSYAFVACSASPSQPQSAPAHSEILSPKVRYLY
ncbi:unnamed protein product [Heligmosomoides polygyrus]|uniref:Uncharacterized protein n=1 Tax=Heligmosomoides polygyrus TaxID=6339 RepID=A0A183GU91_HELPZ|nr:unnamed protein product [Heligmosomoides polygyrus]